MRRIICLAFSMAVAAVSFGQDVLKAESAYQDGYYKILRDKLLPPMEPRPMEWGLLYVPSFEAESALYYSGRTGSPMLIFCYPDSSIWHDVRGQMEKFVEMTEDEQIKELGMSLGMKMSKAVPTGVTYETAVVHSTIHRDTLNIAAEQASVLEKLFATAVGTAVNMLDESTGISTYEDETGKTQYYKTVGLDGETYHMIYERRGAYCWSPGENTKCGRLVAILRNLIETVKSGSNLNPEILERAEQLTADLTELYPTWYREYLQRETDILY